MAELKEGDLLFEIDPTAYQSRVDDLEARLKLASLRLDQYRELESEGAGSGFQLEQSVAEVLQLEAQLQSAQFDLENTKIRAPADGIVPVMMLKEGLQVSPMRTCLLYTSDAADE